MTSDISQLLHRKKSEVLEFAGPRASLETLAKIICGMLNQRGGVVVWGVDEGKRPIGLKDAEGKSQELNDFLMQRITPRPLLSITISDEKKALLVVVDIPHAADKPYSFNRNIWVRLGTQTLRASEDQTAEIVGRMAAQMDRWEREPMPGFTLQDCDVAEFEEARIEITTVGRFGVDVPRTNEELLERLYLSRNGLLTNGAVVLFARQPRVWAPNLAVRVVSYGTDRGESLSNDVIVEAPAIRGLKEVVAVVQQRTGFSGRFDPNKLPRDTRPMYAVFALREGLVNAMVHRDYQLAGSVQVDIFPDRLTIHNPGQLPQGWTPEDLAKRHESQPANPDICRVFYLRNLMEQLGLGTQKLIKSCDELNAPKPIWKSAKGIVSLTLFAAPVPRTHELTGRQKQFVQAAELGPEFKVKDYSELLQVSERQARRDLMELERLGLVERHGKGPSTLYRRVPQSGRN